MHVHSSAPQGRKPRALQGFGGFLLALSTTCSWQVCGWSCQVQGRCVGTERVTGTQYFLPSLPFPNTC